MPRHFITSGSGFEEAGGYSRVVVDGDTAWVAGTTGFDYAAMTITDDVAGQVEQTFRNISDALAKAGFALDDVVRATHYLTDAADWPVCQPIVKRWLGSARPASTMLVVAGLVDPRMKIEIEVTAKRRD